MSEPSGALTGPVQVTGEVLSVKRAGAYHHLTMVAPGVAERFRPGSFVTVAVGGPLTALTLRRGLAVHRVRPTGAYGGTVECVFEADEPGRTWLAAAPAGTPLEVVGPLGRPFALPKEPVTCVLVGRGCASAPLFSLAERLRERSCVVHMVLGARVVHPGEHLGPPELRARRRRCADGRRGQPDRQGGHGHDPHETPSHLPTPGAGAAPSAARSPGSSVPPSEA